MQPATTGPGKGSLDWEMVKEYLRIGVPIGLAIFMETSIFGVVAFLVAKFGTAAIAASQAAMSFSSLVYMLPLSVSMSMTIIIGTEAGRKAWLTAEQYENVGLAFNWLCALILPGLCFLLRYPIARMYITDPEIVLICVQFIVYSCIFMMGDAVAAPIQGILRGYKDVKAPFYSALVAYWGICAPVGLFFDYVLQHGPYSYWQSLDFGLFTSAVILFFRLLYIRKKLRRDNALL
jgi:probable multidrug resistance protein norM